MDKIMEPEKRKHVRYDHSDLSVYIARTGLSGFLKMTPTSKCMDFSLSGMQFGSDQKFKTDEQLIMDLVIQDVELREINAVVVNCEEEKDGSYCTGVRYCFEKSRMNKPQIMHALLQIEDRLRVAQEYPE